jgi:hypothetical protein
MPLSPSVLDGMVINPTFRGEATIAGHFGVKPCPTSSYAWPGSMTGATFSGGAKSPLR